MMMGYDGGMTVGYDGGYDIRQGANMWHKVTENSLYCTNLELRLGGSENG